MIGAATERARLLRFSFVLGIESCCEVDDLSCLGMLNANGWRKGNGWESKGYSEYVAPLWVIRPKD